VHDLRTPEILNFQPPVLANLVGKITHYRQRDVHSPGVRPSVYRQVNDFGVFLRLFVFVSERTNKRHQHQQALPHRQYQDLETSGGRPRAPTSLRPFNTSSSRKRWTQVIVNNLVFIARIGHPVKSVKQKNAGIRRAPGAGCDNKKYNR
jgi:hypothetical protein